MNRTGSVDRIHFQDLAQKDPEDVVRRTRCRYDSQNRVFCLPVFGSEQRVFPHEERIESDEPEKEALHPYMDLFTVHYLLSVTEVTPGGQWVSEKDLPGGAGFFRGPHTLPAFLIADRFGTDPEGFSRRCRDLGGRRLDMADAAFAFDITPRIPAAVLLWAGDEEFPAESRILFDRTISEHLALDIVFALAVGICHRVAAVPASG